MTIGPGRAGPRGSEIHLGPIGMAYYFLLYKNCKKESKLYLGWLNHLQCHVRTRYVSKMSQISDRKQFAIGKSGFFFF